MVPSPLTADPRLQVNGPREALAQRFSEVRAHSLTLAAPLSAEDQCIQSMPDTSPTKWHLAHSSWFFEAVVLRAHVPDYVAFDERFFYLFNSYYEAFGPRHPRSLRGLLTRPALAQVQAYRAHVDAAVQNFIAASDAMVWQQALPLLTLGLHHEQQHQELMLTDILHAMSCNPLLPACQPVPGSTHRPALRIAPATPPLRWLAGPTGTVMIGHDGNGFSFDNETPRHGALLAPYRVADRLVNCGEYLQFIEDGGYRRPELWLSDGWTLVQANGWTCPPYWLAPGDVRAPAGHWQVFGLQGVRALDPLAPVSQVSFYEAAAYAEWARARLPTEFEWEAACGVPG
ncbi:MAG: ergothioneine biosynthesis protein EgtB, partial [Gammaproteobacteria bacterium]